MSIINVLRRFLNFTDGIFYFVAKCNVSLKALRQQSISETELYRAMYL